MLKLILHLVCCAVLLWAWGPAFADSYDFVSTQTVQLHLADFASECVRPRSVEALETNVCQIRFVGVPVIALLLPVGRPTQRLLSLPGGAKLLLTYHSDGISGQILQSLGERLEAMRVVVPDDAKLAVYQDLAANAIRQDNDAISVVVLAMPGKRFVAGPISVGGNLYPSSADLLHAVATKRVQLPISVDQKYLEDSP